MKAEVNPSDAFSPVLIALMKGVVWRDDDATRWQQLLNLQSRVRDHVAALGLELEIDDLEGYALLRQRPLQQGEERARLIPKRPLSYPVSLLLVLLRKALLEADNQGGDRRLVLRYEDVVQLVRHFLKEGPNEAKLADQIGAHINKVKELGFLRPLKGREGEYEVVRLLKTFVDANFLEGLLVTYRAHAAAPGVARAEPQA